MKIIAISGKAQHGKDTAAHFLKLCYDNKNMSTCIIHYADLLKYLCKTYFGWDGAKDEAGRTLLQEVGTGVVRKKDPDYWVRFVVDFLKVFDDIWDVVIIPDCRFPNEVDYLRDAGFDVTHLRIVRDNFDSPLTPEQQNHPSEVAMDDVVPDITVHNAGTVEEFWEMLSHVLP